MTPEGSLEVEYLDGKVEVYPYSSMDGKGWWTEGGVMDGDVKISTLEPRGRIIIPRSAIRKLRLVYNSPEYGEWMRRQRMLESQGLEQSVAFPEHSSSGRGHDFRNELIKQGFTPHPLDTTQPLPPVPGPGEGRNGGVHGQH